MHEIVANGEALGGDAGCGVEQILAMGACAHGLEDRIIGFLRDRVEIPVQRRRFRRHRDGALDLPGIGPEGHRDLRKHDIARLDLPVARDLRGHAAIRVAHGGDARVVDLGDPPKWRIGAFDDVGEFMFVQPRTRLAFERLHGEIGQRAANLQPLQLLGAFDHAQARITFVEIHRRKSGLDELFVQAVAIGTEHADPGAGAHAFHQFANGECLAAFSAPAYVGLGREHAGKRGVVRIFNKKPILVCGREDHEMPACGGPPGQPLRGRALAVPAGKQHRAGASLGHQLADGDASTLHFGLRKGGKFHLREEPLAFSDMRRAHRACPVLLAARARSICGSG